MARRPAREMRAQPPVSGGTSGTPTTPGSTGTPTGPGARPGPASPGGSGAAGPAPVSSRVLTVPNFISFARLLGVPVFLYLFLAAHADAAAITVLAVGGTSDWVDGYVARRLRQVSRLGELLDPLADRLYILATLLAFTAREVVPWQFTAALLAREVVVLAVLAGLRRPLPVHYLGKTATFILLFAFPVLLLAHSVSATEGVAGPVGWGLAWWGLVLYWAAGALYVAQAAQLLRAGRRAAGTTGPNGEPAGNSSGSL